jgi:hypothetical protein
LVLLIYKSGSVCVTAVKIYCPTNSIDAQPKRDDLLSFLGFSKELSAPLMAAVKTLELRGHQVSDHLKARALKKPSIYNQLDACLKPLSSGLFQWIQVQALFLWSRYVPRPRSNFTR